MELNPSAIIVWHPVLTDHQAYTYQELARQTGLPVIAQVVRREDPVRRAQGWTDSLVDGVVRHIIPSRGFLSHCLAILRENRHQVHIFGSPFENLRLMFVLWLAVVLGLRVYLISEPYSPVPVGYFTDRSPWAERIKAALRPVLYKAYILGLRRGLCGVFAISKMGVRQYISAGMPKCSVFPFGYFVPSFGPLVQGRVEAAPRLGGRLRLVFVGSLTARKGLGMLISAVQEAVRQGANIQLDVYGPGDSKDYGFDAERICYLGTIPFGQAQRILRGYDLLVLPSLHDGWGVVVNEALCADVPVLCSDQVGAGVLVETFGAGAIFRAGDLAALVDILIDIAGDEAILKRYKAACKAAEDAIQPSRAASYMNQLLFERSKGGGVIGSPWYGSLE